MSLLASLPVLFSQFVLPGVEGRLRPYIAWGILLGDPGLTIPGILGGVLLWVKVVSLLCLITWVAGWVSSALKDWTMGRFTWLDYGALGAIILGISAAALQILEQTQRIKVYKIANIYSHDLLALIAIVILFLWVESGLWRAIAREKKRIDTLVLVGIHMALALGIAFGLYLASMTPPPPPGSKIPGYTWRNGIVDGARWSATYMGYVVFLRVILMAIGELLRVRARRLTSIALLSITESVRRMWAPWVVITVFLVILAFTHWFLAPPRIAEMGRIYVSTLSFLCMILLAVMVTILTPLSIPHDIQNQTIYTVVSKPVRRIELIWGRMIGFMAIVTVLVVVFYSISLLYLWRNVGGAIRDTEALASKEAQAGRMTQANQLRDQADQLRNRMSARMPIEGSLTFLDSKGTRHLVGIDVGGEQSMKRPRSHIEGATAATAIWTYGPAVPDPFDPEPDPRRQRRLSRPVPVETLLDPDSLEGLLNRVLNVRYLIRSAEEERNDPKVTPARARQLSASIDRNRAEEKRATSAYVKLKSEIDEIEAKAAALPADRAAEADSLRRQAEALHSRPFTLEMSFNVYRTTKGRIGDPVYAQVKVVNPVTGAEKDNIIPIREYYTNRLVIPAGVLAGSLNALRVEVRCMSRTQYLGMAEGDLYILGKSGNFGANFFKGLLGVWLQAMVLTAIGVFAGTFLSWPVALLTTIFFFLTGEVFFPYLLEFSNQSLLGGGPFESMLRMIAHENQMSEMTPTLTVITAKTLDSIFNPVMARLVYIVPNFSALDVSNTVSHGYYVPWMLMLSNGLLALAYAVPFSIAGYIILKNREVAA